MEKQSTLKIRGDEPDYSTGTMPDVIRSRHRPAAAAAASAALHNAGDPTLRRNGRYQQLSSDAVDSSDNEYSTMSKLSGAHIAHILTDHKGYFLHSFCVGVTREPRLHDVPRLIRKKLLLLLQCALAIPVMVLLHYANAINRIPLGCFLRF